MFNPDITWLTSTVPAGVFAKRVTRKDAHRWESLPNTSGSRLHIRFNDDIATWRRLAIKAECRKGPLCLVFHFFFPRTAECFAISACSTCRFARYSARVFSIVITTGLCVSRRCQSGFNESTCAWLWWTCGASERCWLAQNPSASCRCWSFLASSEACNPPFQTTHSNCNCPVGVRWLVLFLHDNQTTHELLFVWTLHGEFLPYSWPPVRKPCLRDHHHKGSHACAWSDTARDYLPFGLRDPCTKPKIINHAILIVEHGQVIGWVMAKFNVCLQPFN